MYIIKDEIIRKKFKGGHQWMNGQKLVFDEGFERTMDVGWFVIHGTAGGGTLNWVRNADPNSPRGQRYARGVALFHYLIERDGTVHEIIDPSKWCLHASIWKLDSGTIGVEMVNPDWGNKDDYTDEQYNSLLELYNYLRGGDYPDMDVMLSHNRCKQKVNYEMKGLTPPRVAKACPGPGFDWNVWRKTVGNDGWDFDFDPNYESLWGLTKY